MSLRSLTLLSLTVALAAACGGDPEDALENDIALASSGGSGGARSGVVGGGSVPRVVDADGDGVADDLGRAVDADGNGVIDAIDLDGDGQSDGAAVDTDGDGVADAAGRDTDGDGIIDALDTDGDGAIDTETVPVVGTGGGTGTGGSEGVGGTSGGGSGDTSELIDDLEDGDVRIAATDGRVGYWYSYNEDSARPRLTAPAASEGGYAVHATGSHRSGQAADTAFGGLGVDLKNSDPNSEGPRSESRATYDASDFDGFEFRVRCGGSCGTKSIRFEIVTTAIATADENGTCTSSKCWDAFGMDVALTGEWRTVRVPYSSVVQEGWGDSKSFDPSKILGIAFEDLGTGSWDFWVDDLAFYTEAAGGGGGGSVGSGAECSDSWGTESNGSITWYTFDQGTHGIGDVNCSFGISAPGTTDRVPNVATGGGTYFGAMNTTDYAGAAACGACVEVTANNGKSVPITIVDQCPIDTNPKCVKGHIDLSKAAYDALGLAEGYWGSRAGKGSISWKYVPCPSVGNVKVRLKEPSNANWNMVLVENHVYPIASVEVKSSRDGQTVWVNASRESYNYWLPPGGRMGTYDVRITDVNGSVIEKRAALSAGSQDTGSQFSCE
jgi:expansin (peptidoglycan-binding protein)